MNVLLLLSLAACGPDSTTDTATPLDPPVGFLAEIASERARGCEDTKMHVTAPDGTRALSILLPGIVARAYATGGAHEARWDFAHDPSDGIAILEGTNVTAQYCTDIMAQDVEVTRTWAFVGGTMTVTVTPTSDGSDPYWTPADASVRIEDASVAAPDHADPVPVGGIAFDADIGWYPG